MYYIPEAEKFVAFYKKQAETSKESHSYKNKQRGGGLGNMLSSLHSTSIPLERRNNINNFSKGITANIVSPAEASVDQATESVKASKKKSIKRQTKRKTNTKSKKLPKSTSKSSAKKKRNLKKNKVKKSRKATQKLIAIRDIFSNHGPIP
jgi:hypothetical protein